MPLGMEPRGEVMMDGGEDGEWVPRVRGLDLAMRDLVLVGDFEVFGG